MVNLTNVYLKVKEFCYKNGLYCSRYYNNIPDSVITIRVEKSFFNSKNYYICKSTPLDDGELTELIINDIKRSFNIKDESNKTMKKPMKTETKKKTNISDESENRYVPEIKNVIFNYPSTTVLWSDGTKTVVKCQKGDKYSMETGLALCIAKKALGNNSDFNDIFKKWIDEPQEKDIEYFERFIEQLTKGIRFI